MHLTIITAKSENGLAQGSVWEWFAKEILKDVHYVVVDVDDLTKLTATGDRILLLGEKPAKLLVDPEVNLFTFRGTICTVMGKPAIATFNLDEAYNFKATDAELEQRGDDAFSKDRGKTSRSNWLFWVKADTLKLLGDIKPPDENIQVITAPPIQGITKELKKLSGHTIYLDIETDIESDTLDCVGFSIDNSPKVFVVPIYRWNGKLAYAAVDVYRFLATLSSALLRNRVVIHNCMYDLLWLSSHLRLPFGPQIYDTMVAHKRILPEIEKSLGHCISYYTFQPYHKDEHTLARSAEAERRLWQYNAKDVFAMRLVHQAQERKAAEIPGLRESIAQANASLYPYLLASLKGLRVDIERLAAAKRQLDRRIAQIRRIILYLIGDPKFNPDSPVQLVKYFHDKLSYKVQSRSKQTGKPSLGGKALYMLALKYPNPLIPCVLYYRELVKGRGMMDFNNHQFPWERTE